MTLAHPFRLTPTGAAATLTPGSPHHAATLAGHVLSTGIGERGLAPRFGLPDPAGAPLDPAMITATLATCAPDLDVSAVTVTGTGTGQASVTLTVDWAGDTTNA